LIDDEEERLLVAARSYGGEIYEIISLAIETAARRSEIASLNWSDVDLENCQAILRDTKNGESRTIPLSATVRRLLKRKRRHIAGTIFSLKPASISQAFKRVCIKANIVDLRFHDLRHEATSRLFERGLSLMEVACITGHKDLAMLRRYTHLNATKLANRIDELGRP